MSANYTAARSPLARGALNRRHDRRLRDPEQRPKRLVRLVTFVQQTSAGRREDSTAGGDPGGGGGGGRVGQVRHRDIQYVVVLEQAGSTVVLHLSVDM